ncbi:peptide MFS transporter [Sphingomicrobium nitratireducens]|uniref:peptide MFS transporter n=1 Tax=Sphingomicrobium nitratireducens TaxID=2964666 RepID=UPI00223F7F2C|nr:peptide MFS transporter [Sphingomicrobium nitratireducens]
MDRTTPLDADEPPATFLGHPKGLLFLAFTEAWERFSFYGMRALLVLYLADELLTAGHIENVAGMGAYRALVESIFGPLSTVALASQTFGLYAGLVYFTPLFGGLLADRVLGAKRTVMLGIALMTAGHFAMAFEPLVLLALALLILGSGCLKGNIAAQVGQLYPPDAEGIRSRGFTLFTLGINVGAVLGPLVCGWLAQEYGWHVGFGTAGIFMLGAAIVYFTGLRHYGADRPRGKDREVAPAMTPNQRRLLALVLLVMLASVLQSLVFDQMFNIGMIWIDQRVSLDSFLGPIPVPWFSSVEPGAEILLIPVLFWLWQRQAARGSEPDDLRKIGIGATLQALGALVLVFGEMAAGGGKVGLVFPLVAMVVTAISFLYQWPTLLAFVSRRAPAPVQSLMMAAVYLTAFFSGTGSGIVGTQYETLGPTAFWSLHVALSGAGAVFFLLLGPALGRAMSRLETPTTP